MFLVMQKKRADEEKFLDTQFNLMAEFLFRFSSFNN